MINNDSKIKGNIWSALIIFGLFGQIAWTIENMYFNIFLYKTVTYDPNAIAIMVAASAITATLTTLLMGVLSDKLGRRKIFISIGYLIWGVIIMSFAFISKENTEKLFPGSNVVALTVAIVVIMDCVMTFFGSTANDAAFNAWVTDVTKPSNRGKAEGLLSALPLVAMLVVFGVFDPLTQAGKWTEFFLIIGGMVILGGFVGIFLIKDNCIKQTEEKSYWKSLIYGFRPSVIKANKPLYIILIATLVYCTALQVFMPYLIIYIEFYLKITNYAIILAIVLTLAAVSSVLLGRMVDKYGKHKFLLPAGVLFTVGMVLMYIIGKTLVNYTSAVTVLLCVFGTIMMAGNLLLMLILTAAARDKMPEAHRGHFAGIRMIFFVLLPMVIGPFIGSTIIRNSSATFYDEFNVLQSVPIPEIFLGAAIVSLFAIIPVVMIIFSMRKSIPNEKLLTRWGKELDRNNPLPEYPRPQLVRDSYINLNGVWEYAIYPTKEGFKGYQGEIVVPFSPETILSGVDRIVTPSDILYYKRVFILDKTFIKDKTVLHFGAVDYECKVFINDKLAGSHKGGFIPFSIDITSLITEGDNEIKLEVKDPTDTSYISRGKQTLKSGGIWYTPQSGIWQTVWLESVDKVNVTSFKLTPDIDRDIIIIKPMVEGKPKNSKSIIKDSGKVLGEYDLTHNQDNEIKIDNPKLWSPENPFLYDIEIVVDNDKVSSYFGMRKFNIGRDDKGIMRLMLNNKPYFHNGLLDQGYWSDGMLTPPSDEAMLYDIKKMKDLGFNMLRKHIKIEPMRWYYHCDREGMLVWQDMINGGRSYSLFTIGILPFIGVKNIDTEQYYRKFGRQDREGREEYYRELDLMIDALYNVVSISVWVPFNEGWGQFDSLKAVDFVRERDNTRVIDHASGWHDQGGGDLNSPHIYFRKVTLPEDKDRAVVLSEFGGYSHKVVGNVFNKERVFGYRVFKNREEFKEAYVKLYEEQIIPYIDKGLSATVYTQVSDVEDEINGILTYDREVCKLEKDDIVELNSRIRL